MLIPDGAEGRKSGGEVLSTRKLQDLVSCAHNLQGIIFSFLLLEANSMKHCQLSKSLDGALQKIKDSGMPHLQEALWQGLLSSQRKWRPDTCLSQGNA